jgi:hypothetical protein
MSPTSLPLYASVLDNYLNNIGRMRMRKKKRKKKRKRKKWSTFLSG